MCCCTAHAYTYTKAQHWPWLKAAQPNARYENRKRIMLVEWRAVVEYEAATAPNCIKYIIESNRINRKTNKPENKWENWKLQWRTWCTRVRVLDMLLGASWQPIALNVSATHQLRAFNSLIMLYINTFCPFLNFANVKKTTLKFTVRVLYTEFFFCILAFWGKIYASLCTVCQFIRTNRSPQVSRAICSPVVSRSMSVMYIIMCRCTM